MMNIKKAAAMMLLMIFLLILPIQSISFGADTSDAAYMIDSFRFYFSSGYYMNSGNTYIAEREEDGTVRVQVRLEGVDESDAPVITVGEEFLDQLDLILHRYDVASWDGFQEIDSGVLDGDSFSMELVMTDGSIITAHGYMSWPEHYASVKGELTEMFVSLYDSVYPNRLDILEEYFQNRILDGGSELGLVEISYPYVAAEDNCFVYGQPEVSEGILGHQMGNFTGGPVWDYDREGADMIVVYLYKEPAKTLENYEQICIRYELYTVDDDCKVTLLGGDWVESGAFWNDGIYAGLFTHEYEGHSYLGYFSKEYNRAGGYTERFFLHLYQLEKEGPVLVESEMLEGSLDQDTWSFEDLEPFVRIAQDYGFTNSLDYWKEHPFDPVIIMQDISEILDLNTTTNYGKGFLAALENTPAGEPVGDFQITGEIRFFGYNY